MPGNSENGEDDELPCVKGESAGDIDFIRRNCERKQQLLKTDQIR